MKKRLLFPAFFLILLSWNFTAKNSSPPEVVVASGRMNVGSSVPGMPCPDPALSWPCSISSISGGKAPPPVGCSVSVSKNAAGRLTVLILKEDLAPAFQALWIQNNQFYTPQTIEMDRGLTLSVMNIDYASYIEPGYYDLSETEDAYQITF